MIASAANWTTTCNRTMSRAQPMHELSHLTESGSAPSRRRRRILFLRNIRANRGAHFVFWNYFRWLRASGEYDADVWFTPESIWNEQNPWFPHRDGVVEKWRLEDYDAVVIGPWDWGAFTQAQRDDPPIPVVQLVLHVRFCEPSHPTYEFLRHRAVRVACQERITQRLLASGAANGLCVTNQHGCDTENLSSPRPDRDRDVDLLVAGVKHPGTAVRVARRLRWSPSLWGRRIEVLPAWIPRAKFLDRLARSRTAVFLPNEAEGFYQPPFEAMALGTLVVCPEFDDAAMGFYVDGVNCVRCAYTVPALAAAARTASRMSPAERARLLAAGLETAQRRTISDERADVLRLFESVVAR